MAETKVVILAAGKGTRMKAEVPKPLVKIAGKPMVSHLLERVKAAGIGAKPVVVVSPAGKPLFEQELADSVEYAVQTEQLGTGHALRSAQELCGQADRIIVLYGDHPFIGADVIKRVNALAQENPEALIMLTVGVPNFDGVYAAFKTWSRILRDENGKMVGDRQVKDASPEELMITEVNPCIYAFPAPWVWEKLAELKNTNAAGEYYLTDVAGMALMEGREIVTAPVDAKEVMGVNSPEELKAAEEVFLAKK